MSTEKDRKEFIDWLADVHGLESEWQEERNCFKDFPAHLAFQAWQASREAIVIDLPPVRPEPVSSGDELKAGGEAASWNIWVGDKLAKAECREAIEAAGLKVKP
jgi:hypothetical protein